MAETETVSLNLSGDFEAVAGRDVNAAIKLSAALEKLDSARSKRAKETPMVDALAGSSGYAKLSDAVSKIFGSAAGSKLDSAAAQLAVSADKLGISPEMLTSAGGALATAAGATAAAGAIVAAAAVALGAAAGAVLYAGVKLGVQEATKNEVNKAILDAVGGGKGQAKIDLATKIALDIGIDDDVALAAVKKAVTAGFSDKQIESIVKVGVGIDAALGPGQGDKFAKTLATVKELGKFDDGAIKKFAKEGISAEQVYAKLAKSLGISVDEAKAKVKAGTLDVNKGIEAVLGVADEKFGAIADKLGNSLPGLYTKLQVAFKGLFGNISLDPIKGVMKGALGVLTGPSGQAFSKAFGKLSDALIKALFGPFEGKGASAKVEAAVGVLVKGINILTKGVEYASAVSGRAWAGIKAAWAVGMAIVSGVAKEAQPLIAAVKSAFADIFSSKPNTIGAELRSIGKDLAVLWGVAKPVVVVVAKLAAGSGLAILGGLFTTAATGVKILVVVLGSVVKAVSMTVGFISTLVGFMTGTGPKLAVGARSAGRAIPQGIVAGIASGMAAAIAAAGSMATGLLAVVKAKLGIASPSKAFALIGTQNALGMAKGMNDNADAPARAGAKLAAKAASGAGGSAAGGAGGAGGAVVVKITNNFAPGTTPAQAAAVADANFEAWSRNMRAWQRQQQEGRAA